MDGFSSKSGSVRSDPSGRMLLIVGTGVERQAAVETIRTFDVDWLRGQSVGNYPIHNSSPDAMIAELEKVTDSGDSGLGHDMVKFQAMGGQNAVLVVAARPELLRSAGRWIARLDNAPLGGAAVKVYRLRYGDAKQIAELLTKTFGASGAATELGRQPDRARIRRRAAVERRPAHRRRQASHDHRLRAGRALRRQRRRFAVRRPRGKVRRRRRRGRRRGRAHHARHPQQRDPHLRRRGDVADDRARHHAARSAEVAGGDRRDDRRGDAERRTDLRRAVLLPEPLRLARQLDRLDLGPSVPPLPGFNFIVGNQVSPQVILSALHQYTTVKILSNPSLVVVDNQVATLEVGDQVPVSTGSATVLSSNNAVVNTIDYKNTGIILRVQPRVNSNGSVLLDVEQEISSIPNSSSSSSSTATTLTPTISTRKVKSELSVANDQTVLLAGLISDQLSNTGSGVPVLDQIPVVGAAFANKDKQLQRTELVLFIRPQIIRNGADAATVASELRAKMRDGRAAGPFGAPPPGQ